jgi:hypothetical protein
MKAFLIVATLLLAGLCLFGSVWTGGLVAYMFFGANDWAIGLSAISGGLLCFAQLNGVISEICDLIARH